MLRFACNDLPSVAPSIPLRFRNLTPRARNAKRFARNVKNGRLQAGNVVRVSYDVSTTTDLNATNAVLISQPMDTNKRSSASTIPTDGLPITWAPRYDCLVDILTLWRAARLRRMTVAQALIKRGDRVLDVGCGTGDVTMAACQAVGPTGAVSGIDPSYVMIAVARRKSADAGHAIDFRPGVIEALPYPDASFDVVTASLMMHHLPESLQAKGIAEVHRVLKPGGRFLIADATRPQCLPARKLFAAISARHGVKFGVEELLPALTAAGFAHAALLPERFMYIGFVRAEKATA